jgi:hypothetical protein
MVCRRRAFGIALGLLLLAAPALAQPPEAKNFVTHLTGAEEVPPVATRAQGQAIFHLDSSESVIVYRLIASNIDNVVAAHIHIGAEGVNGPAVVFLAGPFPPAGGRQAGVLAEGTITEAGFFGPLEGQPLSVLVNAMRSGDTYVNVHTDDGVPPTNTGPGDFPGGEIRGQIRPAGPR